jgi:hypothetical protein
MVPRLVTQQSRLAERGSQPYHVLRLALCAPPQEASKLPLGHHVPNQRHLDDHGAALVQEALDDKFAQEEHRSGHEPREH